MKKIVLLFLIVSSLNGQKVGIGMNLPLLLDNTIDINLSSAVNKRIKLNFNLGGSANTRDIYSTKYNSNSSYPMPSEEYYITQTSSSASGSYAKLGAMFTFNLPDFFSESNDSDGSNFQFYLGPILGISRYKQSGTEVKTPITKFDIAGKPLPNTTAPISTAISEKGKVTGTGFGFGLVLAAKKEISADLGVDILGYERESRFTNQVQTLGMGAIPVLRINYNLGTKK